MCCDRGGDKILALRIVVLFIRMGGVVDVIEE
jgi:hypothetical protein